MASGLVQSFKIMEVVKKIYSKEYLVVQSLKVQYVRFYNKVEAVYIKFKTMGRKLAMPLLGVLLWVISLHAGTFTSASILYNNPVYGTQSLIPLKLTSKQLNDSASFGAGVVSRLGRLEASLGWAGVKVQPGTPSHGQHIVSAAAAEALEQARAALTAARASQHLLNMHCHKLSTNRQYCARLLTTFKLTSTPLQNICSLIEKSCRPDELSSKYRSIDGSCNHVSGPAQVQGKSLTAYRRLLFPQYQDGIMEPRRSTTRAALPSPRLVSAKMVDNVDRLDQELSLAFMQWSQFVAHDMSHTANSKMISSKTPIECCDRSGFTLSPRYIHPMCMPISIPSDDSFYSKHRTNCMSYVRSLPAIRSDCSFGPLEQMNQATHYLDGSHVYGSTTSKSNSLREFISGRLLTSDKEGRKFLPVASDVKDSCQLIDQKQNCYKAGDSRVNMQPHLTAIHTFWTREHNRISQTLEELNPNWDDEKLYQEARRIVVAQIQHITYNHWLPILIGGSNAEKIRKQDDYKPEVDPSVSNAFATAALRFVGSLMTSDLRLYEEDRVVNTSTSLRLQDYFNRPSVLDTPGNLDGLVRGLATQNSQKMDLQFISDITQQLYKTEKYGMDSLSLDIQRSRDHGLPPYIDYREFCGLPKVEIFEDLLNHIPAQTLLALKAVYASPNDIDLIVGALSENALEDSLLGPTFTCLISEQMQRTRMGDRYFYTHSIGAGGFTNEQLKELKKTTLARIFCDNGDDIKTMQLDVFNVISTENGLLDCTNSKIEKLDLSKWKEARLWDNML